MTASNAPQITRPPTRADRKWLAGLLRNEYTIDHLRSASGLPPHAYAMMEKRCRRLAEYLSGKEVAHG